MVRLFVPRRSLRTRCRYERPSNLICHDCYVPQTRVHLFNQMRKLTEVSVAYSLGKVSLDNSAVSFLIQDLF
jgi:hypothetical protein